MDFGKWIHEDLHRYLAGIGRLDKTEPECPDLEGLWPVVRDAYLPDGVREFTAYPVVSLGWMMFVGMAFAMYWDTDWERFSKEGAAALYESLRAARGYDNMDDYIMQDVLGLDDEEAGKVSLMAGECAARVWHALQTSRVEPGTLEAMEAYVAALRQLYLMGIYTELNALGYHIRRIG